MKLVGPAGFTDLTSSSTWQSVLPACDTLIQELVMCDVDVDDDSANTDATQQKLSSTAPAAPQGRTAFGRTLHTTNGGSSSSSSNSVRAPGSSAAAATAAAAAASGGFQPLPPDQQRQLVQLVWGDAGVQPEAAWQQGLIWNDTPGLEWGLLQVSGVYAGAVVTDV
jgi:hypothetical protein